MIFTITLLSLCFFAPAFANSFKSALFLAALTQVLVWSAPSKADSFTFYYKIGNSVSVNAENYEQAFKIASKQCFNNLTGGKYPGESTGLKFIDNCVNPVRNTTCKKKESNISSLRDVTSYVKKETITLKKD